MVELNLKIWPGHILVRSHFTFVLSGDMKIDLLSSEAFFKIEKLLVTFCLPLEYSLSQDLMSEAEKTPNVVQATNKEGLYERLEGLQAK